MKCKTAVSLLPSKDPAEAKHERMFDVPCGLYCRSPLLSITPSLLVSGLLVTSITASGLLTVPKVTSCSRGTAPWPLCCDVWQLEAETKKVTQTGS